MITVWIIFAAFVLFVLVPIQFRNENEKIKKANDFNDHVAEAIYMTSYHK